MLSLLCQWPYFAYLGRAPSTPGAFVAINVTWRNIFMMVALACTLFSGLIAGTGMMVQWRFAALQNQLNERMTLFQREMNAVERRLDRLEARP
jgi:hypothetical protein